MKKEIRLNAFAMNCVAHQSPGLWTHPRDRTAEYNRLPYWIDLARTLERGRFDGLFLAGDWTLTDLNLGCIEATVISGMMASKAICGKPDHIYSAFGAQTPIESDMAAD